MKEPRFRFTTWISLLVGFEGIIFTATTYYSLKWYWILLAILICLIFFLFGFFIDFYIQYREFYKKVKDVYIKHDALSKEFDSKNKILDEYEYAFTHLGQIIIFAITELNSNEKNNFENLFRILSLHKEKISGVKRNE